MAWNYRVVKRAHKRPGAEDYVEYGIHEAFYFEDQGPDQEPSTYTVQPVVVAGESPEDLREILTQMLATLDKPVVDFKE